MFLSMRDDLPPELPSTRAGAPAVVSESVDALTVVSVPADAPAAVPVPADALTAVPAPAHALTAVPVRRRRAWLRVGEATPPIRRRSPLVRLLVLLTSTSALLAVAALVATAAIIPPIGARRAARDAARREVTAQLHADERVVARVFASQRRWTDMWRESFGILVATDRRVLYVGSPPTPLLRPREDGPSELLVESFPYDAAFTLEPRSLFRGLVRGLQLRTPTGLANFVVDDGEWREAMAVSRASGEARLAVTRDLEQLSNTDRSSAPQATEYVPYVVQRGETLTGLARRFGTSPAVLRQLNQLRSDDIRAGQRLRVPRTPGT